MGSSLDSFFLYVDKLEMYKFSRYPLIGPIVDPIIDSLRLCGTLSGIT